MSREHETYPEMVICGCKEHRDVVGGFVKQMRSLDVAQ